MGSTTLRSLCLLAALAASGIALADEDDAHGHDRHLRPDRAAALPLSAVPNDAAPGEPAHGWRYFSDAGRRAVVISPEGLHYLSRGKGLRPVAGTGPST